MLNRLRNGLSSRASSRSSSPAASSGDQFTTPPSPVQDKHDPDDQEETSARKIRLISRDPSAYSLRVTAGPTKDRSTHIVITPNSSTETNLIKTLKSGRRIKIGLRVLIRDHPETCESSEIAKRYFESEGHKGDRYSIQFGLEPLPSSKEYGSSDGKEIDLINAKDLLWGNDFDQPIKDSLPPGFGTALRFVKWVIDPGIVEDVYADKPYLFGPAFSSVNYINISESNPNKEEEKVVIEEDMVHSCPSSENENFPPPPDPKKRRKFFLVPQNREKLSLTPGKIYKMDFCNGFVDFNTFSLMLPHFKMNILRYWDGQPLRYVLKYGEDEVLFVLEFVLVPNAKGLSSSRRDVDAEDVNVGEPEEKTRGSLDEESWNEVEQKMGAVRIEESDKGRRENE